MILTHDIKNPHVVKDTLHWVNSLCRQEAAEMVPS